MRILFIAHMWVPHHNAGGETTAHSAMRAMVNRGHQVAVVCRPHNQEIRFEPYTFEGVSVVRPPEYGEQVWIRDYVERFAADLLITHLDLTSLATQVALDLRKPIAHFVHNDAQLKYWHVGPHKCQLAIFNSRWVAEKERWNGEQIVIHPVVEPDKYRCERGTKTTLVNPTPGKGADTLYSLSRLMPDHQFLVVKGIYGEQIAPPNINADLFPNVEFMEHTPDIKSVFRKTKVLLMPSDYESYGRVAIEAACCGIPTIAHPTEGLRESLGEAGIFRHRDDYPAWRAEIERLYSDEVYYRKKSDAALKLASSLDPESEFDRLEKALLVTLAKWHTQETDKMGKMWTADRRIYKRADGSLTLNPNEAQSLHVGIGGQIPEEEAISLGLMSRPAERTEVLLDTKALTAPPENKAVEAPEEIKTTTKRARRKKTA